MNHKPHSQALHIHWEDARLEFSSATPQGQRGHGTTNYGCQAKRHQNTSHQTCQTSKKTILPRQLTHFSEKLDEIAMIQDDQGAHVTCNKSWQEIRQIRRLHSLAGFLHVRKKTLAQTSPQAPQQKTKCGMVSLRMARHNVNFYSAIVNVLNFTQLIGAWHSRAKWKWDVTTRVKRIENR